MLGYQQSPICNRSSFNADSSKVRDKLFILIIPRTEVLDMKDKLSDLGHLVFLTDSGHRIHGKITVVEKILTALACKMNKKFHEADVTD